MHRARSKGKWSQFSGSMFLGRLPCILHDAWQNRQSVSERIGACALLCTRRLRACLQEGFPLFGGGIRRTGFSSACDWNPIEVRNRRPLHRIDSPGKPERSSLVAQCAWTLKPPKKKDITPHTLWAITHV